MLPLLESIVITIVIQLIHLVFSLVGNAANKYYLKLKESLLILKMKPSLNVAKESIPLYLFENDS